VLSLTVLACLSLTACQDDRPTVTASPSSPTSSSPSSSSSPGTPAPTDESAGAGPVLDSTAQQFLARMRRGMGRAGTAHMEMRIGGRASSTSEGVLVYDARGSQLRLSTRNEQLGAGALQMVVVRDAAYLSLPGLTPAGKYVKIGKDDPRFSQFAGAAVQLGPEQSLKAFRAGLVSVEDLGEDQVQGEDATRFAVKVDAVRALQAQGSDAVPGMPAELTYRVWLDRQDHMRRMSLRMQGVDLRIELSRWGRPVVITPPAKAQLVKPPPGF
jgi:hypothetical protein